MYSHGHKHRQKREVIREKLNEIVTTNDLSEIWRLLNPGKKGFTWYSNHKPQRICSNKTTILPKYGSWISKTIKLNEKWLKCGINTIYRCYVSDLILIMSKDIIL